MVDKTQLILGDVNAALSTVSAGVPVLMAAYTAFRVIWMATHPGTNETDYIMALQQLAADGHKFNASWLAANGYVLQPDGGWKAPE